MVYTTKFWKFGKVLVVLGWIFLSDECPNCQGDPIWDKHLEGGPKWDRSKQNGTQDNRRSRLSKLEITKTLPRAKYKSLPHQTQPNLTLYVAKSFFTKEIKNTKKYESIFKISLKRLDIPKIKIQKKARFLGLKNSGDFEYILGIWDFCAWNFQIWIPDKSRFSCFFN